jgi:hypothetical protein
MPGVGTETDPVIDQTRSVTIGLFAAQLDRGELVAVDPDLALAGWKQRAAVRGDRGLAGILERLDVDTFALTWSTLIGAMACRGRSGMLQWLRERAMRE